MKTLKLILIAFIMFHLKVEAHDGFIVTKSNDTLVGKVRHNFFLVGKRISVENSQGKTRFQYKDIKAYKHRGRYFEKVIYPNRRGALQSYHCMILANGTLRLLEEKQGEIDEHFFIFENTVYRITRRYFPNELWDQLILCPNFNSKYGDYHQGEGGNWINLIKQRRIWIEMVNYYNQNYG